MNKTSKQIAAALARFGKTAEFAVIGWGFTAAEIAAAAKSGHITRTGNQMGGITMFYLSAK